MATVVLVGMPGVGKTTVAKALAARTGSRVVDTDDVVIATRKKSIAQIFAEDGEASFRQSEIAALAFAVESVDIVATGGGIVTTPEAREILRHEFVVWLDAPSEVVATRVSGNDRPLLRNASAESLEILYHERRALYEEVSTIRIEASGSVEDVLAAILVDVEGAS